MGLSCVGMSKGKNDSKSGRKIIKSWKFWRKREIIYKIVTPAARSTGLINEGKGARELPPFLLT